LTSAEARIAPECRRPFVRPFRPPFLPPRPLKQVYDLRKPRPADWGIGVTTCIASKSDDCIVAVADMMVTLDHVSGDTLAAKFMPIGRTWMAMFSGNDVSPAEPIAARVNKRVQQSDPVTAEELALAFEEEYAAEVRRRAEAQVLSVLGLKMETFLNDGLKKLGSSLFSQLLYEVRAVKLDVEFLVFGFDTEAHVFTVSCPGTAFNCDVSGFWAIGSGAVSALGMLFNLQHSQVARPARALYNLSAAKFVSESAPGVGKETLALVLHKNGNRLLFLSKHLSPIRNLWESEGRPRLPPLAESVSQKLIADQEEKERQIRATALPGG